MTQMFEVKQSFEELGGGEKKLIDRAGRVQLVLRAIFQQGENDVC